MSTWLVIAFGRVWPLLWIGDISAAVAGVALRAVMILTGLSVAATFCAAVSRLPAGIPERDVITLGRALADSMAHDRRERPLRAVRRSL